MWDLFDQHLVEAMALALTLTVFFLRFFLWREEIQNTPTKSPRNKAKTKNKLNPHIEPGPSRTHVTLVGGKHSHHCDIPAPQN